MHAAGSRRRRREIGGYQLRRQLGAGGMSEVHRAEKVGPGGAVKPCAIKIILRHFMDNEKRVEAFQKEVRLSSQLSHPNLVEVLNFGVEDGEHYLVLELIKGLDLESLLEALAERAKKHSTIPLSRQGGLAPWQAEMAGWQPYLERGVLPPVMVAFIAMKMCAALAYIHRAEIQEKGVTVVGLIHRDISPCNVMMDVFGRVKITDLGIAKAFMEGAQKASRTDTAWGKFAYAPPEQIAGDEVDPTGDLYAMGITLYVLLTGMHPYHDPHASPNEHPWNRAGRAARDERPPMSELLPSDVPVALQNILQNLIQAKPENRKPMGAGADAPRFSAEDLADRFHEIIKSLGSDIVRLEKQAAALVQSVYVDDEKDRTQEEPIQPRVDEPVQPLMAEAIQTPADERSDVRPVSKVTAAGRPVARRERAPDTLVDGPPAMEQPEPTEPAARSKLMIMVGAASLVLGALVAGIVGYGVPSFDANGGPEPARDAPVAPHVAAVPSTAPDADPTPQPPDAAGRRTGRRVAPRDRFAACRGAE